MVSGQRAHGGLDPSSTGDRMGHPQSRPMDRTITGPTAHIVGTSGPSPSLSDFGGHPTQLLSYVTTKHYQWLVAENQSGAAHLLLPIVAGGLWPGQRLSPQHPDRTCPLCNREENYDLHHMFWTCPHVRDHQAPEIVSTNRAAARAIDAFHNGSMPSLWRRGLPSCCPICPWP